MSAETYISDDINFLLVDDYSTIRSIVKEQLRYFGFKGKIIEAESAEAGIKILEERDREGKTETSIDVIFSDWNMPGMNGIAGLKLALKANVGKPVAILSGNPSPRMLDEIMAIGAAGIILKTTPARSLGNAIRFMHAGEYYMPIELIRDRTQVNNMSSKGKLSGRELSVLSYLAEGRQNKDIAGQLQLAEPTIKMHVTSICKKLGAQNRTQAVIAARNLGMI